jgi:hypothetical protein
MDQFVFLKMVNICIVKKPHFLITLVEHLIFYLLQKEKYLKFGKIYYYASAYKEHKLH